VVQASSFTWPATKPSWPRPRPRQRAGQFTLGRKGLVGAAGCRFAQSLESRTAPPSKTPKSWWTAQQRQVTAARGSPGPGRLLPVSIPLHRAPKLQALFGWTSAMRAPLRVLAVTRVIVAQCPGGGAAV